MTKQKTTKKTLLTSVLSLVLCVAMLVGTTFAWFTDSVTSANNKIQAGNLKIDLELLDKTSGKWNSIKKSNAPIFDYDKWEPGYTDVKVLKVENEGTLALKWVAKFISASELSALANVIDVYVCPSETEIRYPEATDRALSGYTRVGTVADFVNTIEQTTTGELTAGKEAYLGIALKMQESAGNEYQGLSLGGAFDIQIFATQLASEEDSFDNQYDVNAPDSVSLNGVSYENFDAAVAVAKDGDTITVSGNHAPIILSGNITLVLDNAAIKATDNGTSAVTLANDFAGKIVVKGTTTLIGAKGGNGIYVPANTTLDLSGTGRLIAKGNGAVESTAEKVGGSGIGGEGTINIHDLANLNAEGYGNSGFGIGGATKSITVTNSKITYAKGGFVQPLAPENDLWIKNTPEGGAAIGSNVDGATITLKNTTVQNAEGGSKSAGIGARFWTGVTVNIENCTINVTGGNASAGIGGSRVVKAATAEDAITVNIKKSTINATGGQYGAGIGSGYDTYCHSVATAPVTTVNIDAESKITAQGGKLAAGIGTGHNVVNFVGDIQCDVSNVKAGDSNDKCCLGAVCTEAQNVGLGSLKQDAFKNDFTFVSTADELIALGGKSIEGTIILTDDIDLNGASMATIGAAYGKTLTVIGNGYKISNAQLAHTNHNGMKHHSLFYAYTNSTLNISNLVIENVNIDTANDIERNYGVAVVISYADGGSNVVLNNVDVNGCNIKNDNDEAAVYVGYQTGTLTMINCDSTRCSVQGETPGKTGAFIGHCNGNATLTNCSTDLTIGTCNRVTGNLSEN